VYLPYKVLDFFEDLRSRVPERRHQARCRGDAGEIHGRYLHALYLHVSLICLQEYLSWMMEVVCEGDLYRVRDFDAETVQQLPPLPQPPPPRPHPDPSPSPTPNPNPNPNPHQVKRLGEGGGGDDVRSFISQARVRARAGVRVRVNLTL